MAYKHIKYKNSIAFVISRKYISNKKSIQHFTSRLLLL